MLKRIFAFRHLREFDHCLILETFVVTRVTHASVFIHPTASRKLMSNMLTVNEHWLPQAAVYVFVCPLSKKRGEARDGLGQNQESQHL